MLSERILYIDGEAIVIDKPAGLVVHPGAGNANGVTGDLHLKAEILRLTAYRGLSTIEKYGQPGPEGSLTKWMWSDTNQQLTQFAADLLGPSALQADHPWAYELLRARGNSIEGGTTEVLKNIVAERVLGLPKAR